jgi:hypothetical protein
LAFAAPFAALAFGQPPLSADVLVAPTKTIEATVSITTAMNIAVE